MLFKRGIEIGCASMIKLVAKWDMWEVANGKSLVHLFTCWLVIKSYSLIKLTRSNLFYINL